MGKFLEKRSLTPLFLWWSSGYGARWNSGICEVTPLSLFVAKVIPLRQLNGIRDFRWLRRFELQIQLQYLANICDSFFPKITTSNTTNPSTPNSQNKPCGNMDLGVYSCNSYANITNRTRFITRFFAIWKYRKAAQFLAYGASPRTAIQVISQEIDHDQHRSSAEDAPIRATANASSDCVTCCVFDHTATEADRGIQAGNSDCDRLFAVERWIPVFFIGLWKNSLVSVSWLGDYTAGYASFIRDHWAIFW